jgi:hypothetical protein
MNQGSRSKLSFDADEIGALAVIGVAPPALRGPTCPDPALLLAVDEGVVDEELAVRVRAHVAACPACRLAAADLADVLDSGALAEAKSRIAARLPATPARSARRPWFWLVPAGGLVAVAAVIVGMIWFPASSLPDSKPALVARNDAPSLPTVFRLDRPAVQPGDIDLTVRGEASKALGLASQIGGALDLVDAGAFAKAIDQLDAIVRGHPVSRDARLAHGVALLGDGQNTQAVTALEQARALPGDRASDDEVGWFLGVALVRTGDPVRARSVLAPVCDHGGLRSAVACAGLVELQRSSGRK